MSAYNLNLTLENIRTITVMVLDIFILWFILYYTLKIVKGNIRTSQIFKGIVFVVLIDGLAKLFGLKTLQALTGLFINWGFLAVIIIFQPEIRQLLERLGKTNVFSRITTLTGDEKENLVEQIVTAVMLLSKDQTGALISIEQSHSLEDFITTGIRLNSDVTAELLTSIFVTSTPLHDGAVIIQGDKIACASAYFPPTNMELPGRYGARHRAAIGISEITDAVTIVVSEETGSVSITEGGKMMAVNRDQLRDYLLRVILGEATKVSSAGKSKQRPVVVSEAAPQPAAKREGVISKLTLRKQSEKEEPAKIEAEEVVAPEETPEPETPVPAPEPAPVSYEEADKEAIAADIKLPHKKKRPKPSYPVQSERVTAYVNEITNDSAEDYKPQKAKPSSKRMSPEEVKAARDASVKKLSHTEEPEPIIDLEKLSHEDEEIYDTSKLDISKIVGFTNELDKQFEMIDALKDEKSSAKKKGGDE